MAQSQNANALSIIRGLKGNEGSGMCRCPAHDDKKPSLHVEEKNGKVLVHCHSRNCSQEAVIKALRSRGLWHSNGTPRVSRNPDTENAFGEYERLRKGLAICRAAFHGSSSLLKPYLAGRGIDEVPSSAMYLPRKDSKRLTGKNYAAMVFSVRDAEGRFRGAHVTPLTRDGTKKIKKLVRMFGPTKGGFIQLGKLPRKGPLIIAEGPETAMSASICANTPAISALNAGNMAILSPSVLGEIIYAADNDKVGRKAARAGARKLKLNDPRRIVRIATPKLNDWNDEYRNPKADLDVLARSIRKAKRISAPGRGLALGVEEFMSLEFPKREYLMKPWLTTAGLSMAYGRRGVGKSYFALSLAYAVARGEPFLKWQCDRSARVLYVDGELPGELLQKRLAQFGPAPSGDVLKIVSRNRVVTMKKTPLDLSDEEDRNLLDSIIDENRSQLIILDSILTLFSADSQKDFVNWLPVQNWAYNHRDKGRTILYIHHESTSGRQFGISGREIPFDSTIRLQQDPKLPTEPDESAVKLSFEKSRDFFGEDAAPLIAYLSTGEGMVSWRHEADSENKNERVLELKKLGVAQKDIADELGVTQARVSQIVNELRSEKRL